MHSRYSALILFLITLAGCASVDFDYPKTESFALANTGDSYLGRDFADIVAEHPGESGFYPISDGIDALAMRLLMIKQAERSIDAQYFLIHDDLVGNDVGKLRWGRCL